ncbi:hypothetical protein HMPREF3190_00163 [Umbribacter vaginalis]|nr:hypothetical protein HMPREF3190_00163 [Coriobacteriales bacterium DNF00809]
MKVKKNFFKVCNLSVFEGRCARTQKTAARTNAKEHHRARLKNATRNS